VGQLARPGGEGRGSAGVTNSTILATLSIHLCAIGNLSDFDVRGRRRCYRSLGRRTPPDSELGLLSEEAISVTNVIIFTKFVRKPRRPDLLKMLGPGVCIRKEPIFMGWRRGRFGINRVFQAAFYPIFVLAVATFMPRYLLIFGP
jgi:hypothetical protein